MKKSSPARKIFGFTLLELLVVISIIGILVAIGAASFSVAQRQGRDARRRGDMKAVQNAVEQCRAVGTSYTAPADCLTSVTAGSVTTVTGGTGTNAVSVRDPGSNNYSVVTDTATDYLVRATLESGAGGNFDVTDLQ